MPTLQPGSTSQYFDVDIGQTVTVTPGSGGTMLVEYTTDDEATIRNGSATWQAWTLGAVSSATSDVCMFPMFARVTAYTSEGSYEVKGSGTQAALSDSVAWKSDVVSARNAASAAAVVGAAGSQRVILGDSAETNLANIKNALEVGGEVYLVGRGTKLISDTIDNLGSNTRLILDDRLILQQAVRGLSANSLIRNRHYDSDIFSVTGTISTAAISGIAGFRLATVTCPSHPFAIGDAALLKGDTTFTFNGVWVVYSVPNANTFTFLVSSTSDWGPSSGTMTAAQADIKITVEGGAYNYGYTDGNVSTTQTNNCAIILNKVRDATVRNIRGEDAAKYALYFANAQNAKAQNIEFDTPSDGCHFKGPLWGATVENIQGNTGDDCVAFVTQDPLAASINPPDSGGDMRNLSVRGVRQLQSKHNRTVLLEADYGQTIFDADIRDVSVVHQAKYGVMLASYPGFSGTIGKVKISNVRGRYGFGGGAVHITAGGAGQTTTIESVDVDGVYPASPSMDTAPVYIFHTGLALNRLRVANVVMPQDSLVEAVLFTASGGTTQRAEIEDIYFHGDYTNAAGDIYAVKCQAAVNQLKVNGYAGGSGSTRKGALLFLFSPVAGMQVEIGGRHEGATRAMITSTITNVPKVTIRGLNSAGQYCIAGSDSLDLIVDGVSIEAASSGAGFLLAGTSKTYNLWMRGISNVGGIATMSSLTGTTCTYNLKGCDGSLELDGAKITTFTRGAMFWNTNAAYGAGVGLYAMGASATTRIAT
jgi:hypothetical protein